MQKLIPRLILGLSAALSGCAQYTDKRGVEVTWNPETVEAFQISETTRNQVMAELGPPSQIIAMGDETVLYYLYERSAGTGLILVVYNRFDVKTRYDRAVFFFDRGDKLTEYATYIHAPE